jgi:hypothetical protein
MKMTISRRIIEVISVVTGTHEVFVPVREKIVEEESLQPGEPKDIIQAPTPRKYI